MKKSQFAKKVDLTHLKSNIDQALINQILTN